MRTAWLAALLACLVAGCASAPPRAPPDALLADRLFAPAREPIRIDDVFEMNDAMRAFLKQDIAAQLRREGPQDGLAHALQQRAQLKLEYDTARTKNAASTFATRSGNCLSLVIMTAAFA